MVSPAVGCGGAAVMQHKGLTATVLSLLGIAALIVAAVLAIVGIIEATVKLFKSNGAH